MTARPRWPLLACLALSAGLASGVAHAARPARKPAPDTRFVQEQDAAHPWATPIGSIVTDDDVPMGERTGKLLSTAVLISPCLILTARHAVYGDLPAGPGYAVTFAVGNDGNGGPKYHLRAEVVAWGEEGGSTETDWAVLHLERCAGASPQIGWMEWGKPYTGLPVRLTGVMGDKDRSKLWTAAGCQLGYRFMSEHIIGHDCHSVHGASGSPLYLLDERGVPLLVALNEGTAGDLYVGIDAGWLYERVGTLVEKDLAWFAKTFPGRENPQLVLARARGEGGPNPFPPVR